MDTKLPFGKENYKWMIIGLITLVIGFIVMSVDGEQHGFGFFGLTLGPIIVMAGFIIEIYAILKTPETKKPEAKK